MRTEKLVIGVDRVKATELKGMVRVGIALAKLPEDIPWEPVPIKVPCSLSVTDKQIDKNTIYTATLKFKTCEELADRQKYAWRLRLLDGACKLLGSDERPYCVMEVSDTAPDVVTDNQLSEVTVTYHSRRPIATIVP